jgi:Protein of unknown function (DUF3037)
MPEPPPEEDFAYAVLRVVPDLVRGESLNAGVLLFCRRAGFLAARASLDRAALATLAPGVDADAVQRHLEFLVAVAAGDRSAGPLAALPQSERFGWLTAPSSTVVQPSPVHTGLLCRDPAGELERLYDRLVAR